MGVSLLGVKSLGSIGLCLYGSRYFVVGLGFWIWF
jgi:hypothetical protein